MAAALFELATAGCTSGGSVGCAPPNGDKWDHWDMAGSTYVYCYHSTNGAGNSLVIYLQSVCLCFVFFFLSSFSSQTDVTKSVCLL